MVFSKRGIITGLELHFTKDIKIHENHKVLLLWSFVAMYSDLLLAEFYNIDHCRNGIISGHRRVLPLQQQQQRCCEFPRFRQKLDFKSSRLFWAPMTRILVSGFVSFRFGPKPKKNFKIFLGVAWKFFHTFCNFFRSKLIWKWLLSESLKDLS